MAEKQKKLSDAMPGGTVKPGQGKRNTERNKMVTAHRPKVAPKTVAQGPALADKTRKQAARSNVKKLRVIPLGGLNEVGKNMTVIEYDNDIIVIDCGMTFPDEEMLGVDMVIPDITYLTQNREKVRGIVLTHAHEDHIGALPYVLREIDVPVYCTDITAGLVSLRLSEHRNLGKVRLNVRKPGDKLRLGVFEIEFIHTNHSVAGAVALGIKTPVGRVIFTGDYKIDTTPVSGRMIDLDRFGQMGREGVLLLMSDSTNAERPGFTPSERQVSEALDEEFKNCDKRIIIAQFASNVDRIQQILNISAKYGRKVAFTGRSMENMLKVGTDLGYLKLPPDTLVDAATIKKRPMEKMTVITTGSQGEPMSALFRMAYGGHKQVEIGPRDKVLLSAHPIPGNEKTVYSMVNELFRKGAEVVYDRDSAIHASGHACQEELKMMLALTRPKFFLPLHGEYRHLMIHARLATQTGVRKENVFISENGKVLELDGKTASWGGTVPSGRVMVDGYGVGDVGTLVLKERKALSEDGVIVISMVVDRQTGAIVNGPEIVSQGFIFVKESEEILREMQKLVVETSRQQLDKNKGDFVTLRRIIGDQMSDYLYKKTKRTPVVLTIVMDCRPKTR